eukprot:GHVU01126726.1.p2 GENE.GHVU01126726.1~~GHVU01126726.1.p2  ORF type:complete len:100 (+),score=2.57 GHVU01126726.1:318-617(+)
MKESQKSHLGGIVFLNIFSHIVFPIFFTLSSSFFNRFVPALLSSTPFFSFFFPFYTRPYGHLAVSRVSGQRGFSPVCHPAEAGGRESYECHFDSRFMTS